MNNEQIEMFPKENKTRVVHYNKEPYDVYIGRPSIFGNPFSHLDGTLARFKVGSREEAISKYREWLMSQPLLVDRVKRELKGKVLGCWCKPKSCHGDVLAEVADKESNEL